MSIFEIKKAELWGAARLCGQEEIPKRKPVIVGFTLGPNKK
jgi:hypothetical protein